MPGNVNNFTGVGSEVYFDGLPVHDVIGENPKRDRFKGIVGEQQDFARMEDVEIGGRG